MNSRDHFTLAVFFKKLISLVYHFYCFPQRADLSSMANIRDKPGGWWNTRTHTMRRWGGRVVWSSELSERKGEGFFFVMRKDGSTEVGWLVGDAGVGFEKARRHSVSTLDWHICQRAAAFELSTCLDCSYSSLTYKQEAHHPPEGQLPHCLPLLPLFLGNEDLRSSASSFVSEQMYQETAIFVSRHCLLLLQITAH